MSQELGTTILEVTMLNSILAILLLLSIGIFGKTIEGSYSSISEELRLVNASTPHSDGLYVNGVATDTANKNPIHNAPKKSP